MTRLRALSVLLCLLVSTAGAVDGADARKRGRLAASKQKRSRSVHVPRALLLAPLFPGAPASGGATATQAPEQPAGDAPQGSDPQPTPVTALGVTHREFSTVLSRLSVPAGEVVVQVRNAGEDPHDLQVIALDGQGGGDAFAAVEPGATATKRVPMAAGTYYLFCSLVDSVDHRQAGMQATLTVTAPA